MATIFGVDSVYAANTQLSNGYKLYDWIMRMNSYPSFWGRSISGESRISEDEIEYLRENDCKIMLVFDDLTEESVSGDDGTIDAIREINAARELGVPENNGIAIFVIIKPEWSVNHNWMMRFAETLSANGYVPGFIGNTDSSKNFNFDRQCGHYIQATAEVDCYGAVFGATEPKMEGEIIEWLPFCPSDFSREDIGLWQNGSVSWGDMLINTIYARDDEMLKYMWN